MNPESYQHAKDLYHAAYSMLPPERDAYLRERCGADEELLREVGSLLAADERAGDFLHKPALALDAEARLRDQRTALSGRRVAHYEISYLLGAGGMGEVWRAFDPRLERLVALKVLPLHFASDANRLQRFIREAKTASALNHQNIVTIHDIGQVLTEAGELHYIATELIEGETLRQRLKARGQFAWREAVEIASQIAAALDAAHRVGIVHRDIKPENVMLRSDGVVKVLDFGLAKTTAPSLTDISLTQSGTVIGTLRYMSPEQARDHEVNPPSDIFSLGTVLYELLTGQPLFAGENHIEVGAAILNYQPPPLGDTVPDAPAELERVLRQALAKNMEDRYSTVRALLDDLQSLKGSDDRVISVAFARPNDSVARSWRAPRFALWQMLALIPLVLFLVGGIWWLKFKRPSQVETPEITSLKTVEVANWLSTPGEGYSSGTFSPDLKWVAYTSTEDGNKNIWIKQSTKEGAAQCTADDLSNENPIWSPESDEIAFYSPRADSPGIWRKPPFGGTPKLIKSLPAGDSRPKLLRWSKDGATIYYELKNNLFALDLKSGEFRPLTIFGTNKVTFSSLSISLDEQQIAYFTTDANGINALFVQPVQGGVAQQLAQMTGSARNTVWHPDGKRIFLSAKVDGILQIFIADIYGHQPIQLTFGDKENLMSDVSVDGKKILYGSSKEESDIWGVKTANLENAPVVANVDFEYWPHISFEGRVMAYQAVRNMSQGGQTYAGSILTKQLNPSTTPVLLTANGALPKWSPDGAQLAFFRATAKSRAICVINAHGVEERELVSDPLLGVEYAVLPYQQLDTSSFDWAPDSRSLVYFAPRNSQSNLWQVEIESRQVRQLTDNSDLTQQLRCPLWSADGRYIAYASRPNRAAANGKLSYSIWNYEIETKKSKRIFEAEVFLRLLGWSATGEDLVIASINQKSGSVKPTAVQLLRVSLRTGVMRTIATLQGAYLYNIHLSDDKRKIAFSAHREGKDDIWWLPVEGGVAKRLTANQDPRFYISSLAWTPDSQTIYYGKQVRYSQLSMISNFE